MESAKESEEVPYRYIGIVAVTIAAILAAAATGEDDRSFGLLALEYRSRQPVIPVPPTTKPPVIDGKIGYKEWTDASIHRAFIDQRAGVQHDLTTELYFKYDEEALYVGVLIERPRFARDPKASFEKGKHKAIWWKDDNFELFLIPGERQKHSKYCYVFVGNSKGAYSEMIQPVGPSPAAEWDGQWEYVARVSSRGNLDFSWPCWEAELKIPYSQFRTLQKPEPGVEWELAFMSQQVTPVKKMITLSQAWSYQSKGYESLTMGRLRFVSEGFCIRQQRIGRILSEDKKRLVANELFLKNNSDTPAKFNIHTSLYRAEQKRPESKETFLNLWDMVGYMDRTGDKMLQDPKMAVQAFRSRADIVKELNDRYRFIRKQDNKYAVKADSVSYYRFEEPLKHGEYLLMTEMREAETGALFYSSILPVAYFPGFNINAYPYFLRHNKVRAELDLSSFDPGVSRDTIEVVLTSEGGDVLEKTQVKDFTVYEKVNAYVDTSKVAQNTSAILRARLVGQKGETKYEEQTRIFRPENPDWFGNDIGKSKVICEPFQALKKTSKNTVELYKRTYKLGASGLPESVVARGDELLAQPMHFELRVDREVNSDDFKLALASFSDREGKWSSTCTNDKLRIEILTTLAYDGMLRYDVSFEPRKGPVTIKEFSLNIPVKKEWSRYFGHHAIGTRPATYSPICKAGLLGRWFKEYGDGMPFTFAFMLAAEDRGIQWFCPSDRNWSNQDEFKKIAVRSDDRSNTLVVSLIDKDKTLKEKAAYNFGITVTPVRPSDPDHPVEISNGPGPQFLIEGVDEKKKTWGHQMLKASRETGGIIGIHGYLDPQQIGVPRLYDEEQEKKYIEGVKVMHQYGMKYIPYSTWGVNTRLPFFKSFGYEMLREPFKDISFGAFQHTMSSTFPDWFLSNLVHLRDKMKVDGHYMDSTQYPRLCFNELEGMAWIDEKGRKHGTYEIWAQREFAERVYVFWHHESKPKGIISSHVSQVPLYFLAPFTDCMVAGEFHIEGKTLDEQCPLDTFQMFYATWPHGVSTHRLWWNWYYKPLQRSQVWTMCLLHDVLMRNCGGNVLAYANSVGYGKASRPYKRVRRVRREFNGSEFSPYWSQQTVEFRPPGPKASVWVNKTRKAAFIFAGNIPNQEYSGTMTIDKQALPAGISPNAFDAMLDQELGTIDEPIRISIKPMRYRMVTVGLRIPLPQGIRFMNDD